MPWWAHSRKATLSRVYEVKFIDPFCLVDVPAKFGPSFVFLKGKQGLMEVKGWIVGSLFYIFYFIII
jgi:hypothetical protein